MKYSPHVWAQLKSITADELIRGLEKDGWIRTDTVGAMMVYRHPDGRCVSIHYHPRKTYGPKLLKSLLADIGWSEDDLRRLRLVK
ncbi:TPA: addiction module toxin, HicA family [Candidatus Acetothermia bacterium]|nr:addiction module toxin, HicA family [Candidatus Acetothermia bacterium]